MESRRCAVTAVLPVQSYMMQTIQTMYSVFIQPSTLPSTLVIFFRFNYVFVSLISSPSSSPLSEHWKWVELFLCRFQICGGMFEVWPERPEGERLRKYRFCAVYNGM